MENDKEYSDQALRQLFGNLPEDKISPVLNQEIMNRVFREKTFLHRRNQILIWGCTSLFSLGIIGLCIFVMQHFSIDLFRFFKGALRFPEIPETNWSFYIFIGGAALLLLFTDNLIRRWLNKHKFTDRTF